MKIYSAPLQGYTEAVWRNLHSSVFGGVDTYYTPFLRYERNEIRSKDIRDVERKNNTVQSLVPQIIASSSEEMQPLLELIRAEGYNRVDINMGCSFILQAKRKRGAGILPYPDMVSALMQEVSKNKDIKFSVKMRLGWESKDEWRELMPILNDAPLCSVTMHPRLGVEQYKKSVSQLEIDKRGLSTQLRNASSDIYRKNNDYRVLQDKYNSLKYKYDDLVNKRNQNKEIKRGKHR